MEEEKEKDNILENSKSPVLFKLIITTSCIIDILVAFGFTLFHALQNQKQFLPSEILYFSIQNCVASCFTEIAIISTIRAIIIFLLYVVASFKSLYPSIIIAFAVSALLITEVIFNFVSFSQYVILKLVFEGVCFIISWMHVLIIWRARIQIQRQEDIWVYATRRPNYSQIGPLLVTDPELINQSKLFRPSSVESRYSSFPNNQTSPEIEESNSRAIPSSSNENFGVSPPFQKPSNKRSSTILPKQERIVALMLEPESGVPLKENKDSKGRKYSNSFTGTSAIDWFIEKTTYFEAREDAVEFLQGLIDSELIETCNYDSARDASQAFYKFSEEKIRHLKELRPSLVSGFHIEKTPSNEKPGNKIPEPPKPKNLNKRRSYGEYLRQKEQEKEDFLNQTVNPSGSPELPPSSTLPEVQEKPIDIPPPKQTSQENDTLSSPSPNFSLDSNGQKKIPPSLVNALKSMKDPQTGIKFRDVEEKISETEKLVHHNCFTGRDAIDWFLKSKDLEDFPEHRKLGLYSFNKMMKQGLIKSVGHTSAFIDGDSCYRFVD